MKRELDSSLKLTWRPSDANYKQHKCVLDICAKNINHKVRPYDSGHAFGFDVMNFENNDWVDDTVLDSLLKSMAMKSTDSEGQRAMILGSQMRNFAHNNENHKLKRVLRGFLLFHIVVV